ARSRASSPGRRPSPSACVAGTIAPTSARTRRTRSCAGAACRTSKARARTAGGSDPRRRARMRPHGHGPVAPGPSSRSGMSPSPRPNALSWLLLSAVVVLLDQLTKWWVLTSLPEYTAIPVIEGCWNWYRTYNTGAAFSFLADAGGWQKWFFTVLAVGISGLLAFWLSRTPRGDWRTALPFSLVVGGALGNVIDRQLHGHVVDFIQWHWRDYYWPAFNVADCAVVGGAIGIVLFGLFQGRANVGRD